MKGTKRLVESGLVLSMAAALTVAAVLSGNTKVGTKKQETAELACENQGIEENAIAGVSGTLLDYELDAEEEISGEASLEAGQGVILAAAYEEDTDLLLADSADQQEVVEAGEEETTEVSDSADSSQEAETVEDETSLTPDSDWTNYLMADVDSSLNVHQDASVDSEVVGKLHQGDVATVIFVGAEWTKISSGNVSGFVANEFCLYGQDAKDYALENYKTVATATTDCLRVRNGQSTQAGAVKVIGKGDSLEVDADASTNPGWVAVLYNDTTCYVSEEYVTVAMSTGVANTMEEEEAEIAAELAAQAAAKASSAKSGSNQKSSSGTTQGTSLAASADDTTLLAALIQCEAGGQSYDCQLAVGAVVVNRVKSGSYPNSIYNVIYQKSQFGPASSGRLESRLASGVSDTAYSAAVAALGGSDNTGGAIGFQNASGGHAGTTIGALVFY